MVRSGRIAAASLFLTVGDPLSQEDEPNDDTNEEAEEVTLPSREKFTDSGNINKEYEPNEENKSFQKKIKMSTGAIVGLVAGGSVVVGGIIYLATRKKASPIQPFEFVSECFLLHLSVFVANGS